MWPYGEKPTRFLCPWDSPGKNTGLGCHFLLQFEHLEAHQIQHAIKWISYSTPWNIYLICILYESVQFSHSVISNSWWPHGLQHTRLPCPLWTPRAYPNSMMPPNHLIFCHPFLLLPSIFPSIRVSSNESVLHIRWPKDWSSSFSACNKVLPFLQLNGDKKV